MNRSDTARSHHEQYMREALRLAKRATRAVTPNPRVGAIVVNNNAMVGKGYHKKGGGPHAEVAALENAGNNARGATLYVTLEPCSTYGKTPPCTEAIIKAGISHVVIGAIDPNPLHAGTSVTLFEQEGIKVTTGILEQQCRDLIEDFSTYITRNKPFTIVKTATSLDGKIATHTGESKWITSPASRTVVQKIRAQVDAILVGARTIVNDNPSLTVRLKGYRHRQPLRIIVDPDSIVPDTSIVLTDEYKDRTVIITADTDAARLRSGHYEKNGVRVLYLPCRDGVISPHDIQSTLAQLSVVSLLVEGGGMTVGHFFDNRCIDKVYCFIAPKIIGGKCAPGPFHAQGIANLDQAVQFKSFTWKQYGPDMLLCGYPVWT